MSRRTVLKGQRPVFSVGIVHAAHDDGLERLSALAHRLAQESVDVGIDRDRGTHGIVIAHQVLS